MSQPHDPNKTVDVTVDSVDSLEAGLAAGFGKVSGPPRSGLDASQRPVLLREAEGESDHVVKPHSDAMPDRAEAGDRYQLFGEIARGGMGAVLRGRDVDLGRDLAVKVLLERHADNPAVARRFLEEAQIGGQLQHPGVVPVYDIGHFGDRPFFTMKLVKGKTLAAILGDGSADRPRLLSIALQVSQALAYAHAKGVIHRDLKPANVMVGAFGEVQVMDWGLAKVLAEGGVADEERASRLHQRPDEGTMIRTARSSSSGHGTDTEAGSLLGTPAYMPPEQANGDIANLDRRADVFGLGAILCEILTGKPPYVGRSHEEVRRKAFNGDLADATARLDGCGADAELIVLTKTCLSPEATDRPKDAQAVADGLTAYLDGVQDRLRQAELAEAEAKARAVEEAKRRRLTLALAATILLAMGLGGGGWLWVKADRDARTAQVSRDVNDALNKATILRAQAKGATVGGAALFAQAREQAQRASALIKNGSADEALQEKVRQLQTESDEEEKDRILLVALDAARLAQAETVTGENRYAFERAVPLFRKALRGYGLAVGEGTPQKAAERIRQRRATVQEAILATLDEWIVFASHPEFGVTKLDLEWLEAVADTAEPADAWLRQFRVARAGKDIAKRREALEKLAEEAGVRKPPAQALVRLAYGLVDAEAAASAVRLLRRARVHNPSDFWLNLNLGLWLMKGSPPEDAEAIRFLTAAVALRPDCPNVYTTLGFALLRQGRYDEAEAYHRVAIELDPGYVTGHNNLGVALMEKGRLDDAIACHRKAIELDPNCTDAYNNLGNVLMNKGQVNQAIAWYRKALELDPKCAIAHYNLGNGFMDKRQLDDAIAWYRKALELDPKWVHAHYNLGNALLGKGEVDKAIVCYRRAVEIDRNCVRAHFNLGNVLLKHKGRLDEAIACYRIAIEIDPTHSEARNNLSLAEQRASRIARVRDKLPAFQNGSYEPAKNDDRLGVATWCVVKKRYRAAAGLYADAFGADPALADDLKDAHRYSAACYAALAAAGQGEDAAKLDDAAKVKLRAQAIDWLKADLSLWAKMVESARPADRALVAQKMRHWQKDSDLAGLRNAAALAKLPADEQKAFTQFWADVDALLKKAKEKPK